MLVFSQVRGPHSTGVGSIDSYNKQSPCILAKQVGRPDMLMDYDKRYDRAVDTSKKFILGHNRWATTGKINNKNAHPFVFDNILGCHNGTVGEFSLKKLKKDFSDYGTDSEAILANINEYGVEEVLAPLYGAWALVWYDKRDDSVNLLRNNERTLYYTYSADRKMLFWASEDGFLKAAIDRNELDRDKIYELPVNVHFKWKIPDRNKAFDKPEQIKIKTEVYNSSFPVRNHPWFGADDDEHPTRQQSHIPAAGSNSASQQGAKIIHLTAKDGANANVKKPDVPKVKDFSSHNELTGIDGQGYVKRGNKTVQYYRGYRGMQITKTEFETVTKRGCAWCGTDAHWGQPVRFVAADEHICLECNHDPDVRLAAVGESK